MSKLPYTVLIVDDEAHVRELLESYFAEHGWHCVVAGSGEEALALPNVPICDAALLDIHLAGRLSGHDLVSRVKEIAPDCAILLMSGKADMEDLLKGFDEQVFAFLRKPFSALGEVVHDATRGAESARLKSENREYLKRLEARNLSLEDAVAQRTDEAERSRRALSQLFSVSSQLGRIESLDELLVFLCKSIVEAGWFERAAVVLGDKRYRISHAAEHDSLSGTRLLSDLRGEPMMPLQPETTRRVVGGGIEQVSPPSSGELHRLLILPIERYDGSVLGFLSADRPVAGYSASNQTTEPIELLLRHAAMQIESHEYRRELKQRTDELEVRVTERTAELRQSQERFSRLVNLTTDVVYITDNAGRIAYLNEAFSRELGYSRENFTGIPIEKLLFEIASESAENKQEIERLLSTQKDHALCHVELFTRSGDKRLYEVNRSWIRQGDSIVAGQGIARDMTEQRHLTQRLISSERLAATGRLASGIAHEINNPLQAIASHISAMREKGVRGEKFSDSVEIVSEALERIRSILRSLLDMHRVQSAPRVAVNLNEALQRVLTLLTQQIREAAVEVELQLDKDLPPVPAAASEMQQVMLNLIVNALDAMPGGGKLAIQSRVIENRAEILFTDTGVGMSADVQAKIFEPFASFKAQGGGTGLGLFIVRNILAAHGGEIEVKSKQGEGSEFIIKMPM
ncbi:response regulator [bacterium]|nr:response regulator [bacterium]